MDEPVHGFVELMLAQTIEWRTGKSQMRMR
jgi:hypothetical protein